MGMNSENASKLLIDEFDKGARENILRIDQKLKGLRAELDAKIRGFDLRKSTQFPGDKGAMIQMGEELDMTINLIENMINMASDGTDEMQKAFLTEPQMQLFSLKLEEILQKITQVSESF